MKYFFSICSFLLFFQIKIFPESNWNKNCVGKIKLQTVVACVLDHSPEYRVAQIEMKSFQGRKQISAYLFPSNPILSFSFATRSGSSGENFGERKIVQVPNGEIAFSQEINLNSQRKMKMNIVDLETNAQTAKIKAIERDTIAESISASIRYEYSKLLMEEYKKFYEISLSMQKVISKRADTGLLPAVEKDLADSEVIRNFKIYQELIRSFKKSKAELTILMGVPPDIDLSIIDLPTEIYLKEKVKSELLEFALQNRAEVYMKEIEILAWKKRTELLHMEKTPNLTVGGFVQKDGFNENVVGARVSMPLKIWRNNSGEIIEAVSKTEQADAILEIQKHSIELEVLKAITDFQSLEEENAKYSEELFDRISTSLLGIQKAISAGQVQLKDTLVLQQSLINTKLSYLETKKNKLLAGIELVRSVGLNFLDMEK